MDSEVSGVQASSYLMIQNPGEAPPEGFMVLGVSTTAGTDGTIGQFGSGNKHAINLCLRNKIDPIVFCGTLRLSFFVKPHQMNDGLTIKHYGKVFCRVTGSRGEQKQVKRTEDLNFSVDYGKFDWNNLAMGLREFVSNALDRTIREEGSFCKALKDRRLTVEIVDASQVRAKSGYTRVYLPLTPDINQFYLELPKRFLHFSEPELLNTVILPKRDRNVTEGKRVAVVYKKGVLVREITDYEEPSLFDYNFDDELVLDESRVVSDYEVKEAATKALRAADSEAIARVFKAAIDRQKVWELTFESYYLSTERIYDAALRDKARKNWKEGWEKAVGEEGVVLAHEDDEQIIKYAQSKGHKVKVVEAATLVRASKENDVQTVQKVLDPHEAKGRKILDPTPVALEAVDIVWNKLVKLDLTRHKQKPPVNCFREIMSRENMTHGYYNNGVVYINEHVANNGINKLLMEAVVEEVAHHVTGATDLSLDFQGYFRKIIVEMWWKENGWT